jgi:hypothetical protein
MSAESLSFGFQDDPTKHVLSSAIPLLENRWPEFDHI